MQELDAQRLANSVMDNARETFSAAWQLLIQVDALEGVEIPYHNATGLAIAADRLRVCLGEPAKIKNEP